jgi:hypothetical protein
MANDEHADPTGDLLQAVLDRSTELHDALMEALRMDETFELAAPLHGVGTAFLAAELSLEHGSGLRALMATGHPRTAAATVRMQFEAVVRSAWAVWAATPREIDLLEQDLTFASEEAAKRVGVYAAMKSALKASNCPSVLLEQVATFDEVIWKSLNSYVHGGIHALKRGEEGFPLWLALQIVKTSNGLVTMAVALLSKLTGEDRGLAEINQLLPAFQDCLPELHPRKKA